MKNISMTPADAIRILDHAIAHGTNFPVSFAQLRAALECLQTEINTKDQGETK